MARRPQDAVRESTEDLLSRSAFVEHLERALIAECKDCKKSRSTGAVVALTGEWGSGKSSILNLLECRLINRDDCKTIRFVPWFVSSGDHLIRYFFELLAKHLAPDYVDRDDLVEDLLAYGRLATYGADASAPGTGALARGLLDFVGRRIKKNPDIFNYKHRIEQELNRRQLNLVCIIDEIDRLSSNEIREVARLIRAIGDFERISYLLAFDERIVAKALGEGSENPTAAGNEYLQKIVSLRIPMPKIAPFEGSIVLRSQLDRLVADGLLPENYALDERFHWLEENIADASAPPRTLIRSAEKFSVIRRMIGDNADWCDVLAFAFLEEHARGCCDKIRENPEKYVQNPVSINDAAFLLRDETKRREALRSEMNYGELPDSVKEIISGIFPRLGSVYDARAQDADPAFNRIRFRSPLQALFRLGLVPGQISHEDLVQSIKTRDSLEALLINSFRSKSGELIDQVFDYLGRNGDAFLIRSQTIRTLKAFEDGIEDITDSRSIGDKVADTFVEDRRLNRDQLIYIIHSSLDECWSQISQILRRYVFMHGLYKWRKRDYGNPNLDPKTVEALVVDYIKLIDSKGGVARVLSDAKTSHALWLMMDFHEDNGQAIRDSFESAVQVRVNFENFLKLCFGPGYSTDFSSVAGLLSKEDIRSLIEKWQLENSDERHLQLAAHAARERWCADEN